MHVSRRAQPFLLRSVQCLPARTSSQYLHLVRCRLGLFLRRRAQKFLCFEWRLRGWPEWVQWCRAGAPGTRGAANYGMGSHHSGRDERKSQRPPRTPGTPEAAGDYAAGPNHALPTAGAARAYGGVTVEMFQKTTTLLELSEESLEFIAPVVERLAALEGLDAHRLAMALRRNRKTDQ